MALYRRLTLMEREELSRMLAAGYSLRATAQALQRAPSTVSLSRVPKCPQLWSSKIPHPVTLSVTLLRPAPSWL